MIQIYNLKSVGEDEYNKTIEKLKNYVDLLNLQHHINQNFELLLEEENNNIIKIQNKNNNFIWNFVLDFELEAANLQKVKIFRNNDKLTQTVWLTNKNKYIDADLFVNLQNMDIFYFFTDYLSILEADRFPNNCDLQDYFQITKYKKLQYNRCQISENNIENVIKELFNSQLNNKLPIIYHLKTNELLENSLQFITQIEEIFNSDINLSDRIWCILNRKTKEISILTEI